MKKLIVVNGTMGVGKSTLCEKLLREVDNSIWLDGDWCWMMNPWNFSEENKKMVIDNIVYLLNNYLSNSNFEFIIFSWVINKKEILDLILERLSGRQFELIQFTVTCSEASLIQRQTARGNSSEIIKEAVRRLEDYKEIDTIKIDSDQDMQQIVNKIKQLIMNNR